MQAREPEFCSPELHKLLGKAMLPITLVLESEDRRLPKTYWPMSIAELVNS